MTTEHDDLISALARHRGFLHQTIEGLRPEQLRLRPTPSELCLGGIVGHVTSAEASWATFIVDGPGGFPPLPSTWEELAAADIDLGAWADGFACPEGATAESLVAAHAEVAARTEEILRSTPDLGAANPLPTAPWFEVGGVWSARRTVMHILAETAQHAGHADIIREAIDGAKTMG